MMRLSGKCKIFWTVNNVGTVLPFFVVWYMISWLYQIPLYTRLVGHCPIVRKSMFLIFLAKRQNTCKINQPGKRQMERQTHSVPSKKQLSLLVSQPLKTNIAKKANKSCSKRNFLEDPLLQRPLLRFHDQLTGSS